MAYTAQVDPAVALEIKRNRIRKLLGPEAVNDAKRNKARKIDAAPVRTTDAHGGRMPARIRALYDTRGREIAENYGIELSRGCAIQYR